MRYLEHVGAVHFLESGTKYSTFKRMTSALRILKPRKALRPRLNCTAVLVARALRFAVSKHSKRHRVIVVDESMMVNLKELQRPYVLILQIRIGVQGQIVADAVAEFVMSDSGNHGCVIGG